MASRMDGSWSGHSCQLPWELSQELPGAVHIEARESFMGVPATVEGLAWLLEGEGVPVDLGEAYSIHLWAHLWWEHERLDFSPISAHQLTLAQLRSSDTPIARLLQPFLPELELDDVPEPADAG